MNNSTEESRRDSDGWVEVEPVNRVRNQSGTVEYEYTYSQVHIDDVDGVSVDGVELRRDWDAIRWKYEGKTPVWVEQFGVYAKKDANIREAEEQAYFALSILAGGGYVSDWSKL